MKDDEKDLYFVEGIAVPQTPLPGEEPASLGEDGGHRPEAAAG